ncbi:MAG TPA: potassium/proton antiporter [Thermoleophilaceae bacterium]|nr:potassium/proton antiporter [Thermoleophilaceae bacterium]
MHDGTLILIAGSLLALGIAATLLAGRLRVPGLVLFLVLGMAMGSDGLGLIEFGSTESDVELARTIGIIALALILFEGGLGAGWGEIRPVLRGAAPLASLGTLITAAITGLLSHVLFDFTVLEGLLLGSVIASTDSAAIFSVLRGSNIRRKLARTLEAESGFNDPIAVLLVLGFIEWIQAPGGYGVADMAVLMVQQLSIGALVGFVIGAAAVAAFRKVAFATTGLYPVASIATAAIAFGLADQLGGSGFLAVYMAGLSLGGARIPARRTIDDFHAGLAWVAQIALFFTLGLLVFPSELGSVALDGLLLAIVLTLIARPIATFASISLAGYSPREMALVSWSGLRGALPVVFATFPVIDGVKNADELFNLVFFVVITSALVQGATINPMARWLKLTSRAEAIPPPVMEVGTIRRLGAEVLEFPVGSDDALVGRLVNELGLPRDALVNVIVRDDEALLPRGSTEVAAGDRLHIVVRENARSDVEALFARWRDGPIARPAPERISAPQGRSPIFSVRPWRDEDGDPAAPEQIADVAVNRTLRTRREARGALVLLADGRLAVTGEGVVATGSARQLVRFCRDRVGRAQSPQAKAWWQEVAGAVLQSSAP